MLNLILISYDLHKPAKDYPDLYTAIQGLGEWAHPLESVWLVYTSMTTSQVNSAIAKIVDNDDSYFVMPVTQTAVGRLPQTIWDWLNPKVGL